MIEITQEKTVLVTTRLSAEQFVDNYLKEVRKEYSPNAKPFTYLFYAPSKVNGEGMMSFVFDINIGKELPEFDRRSPDWSFIRNFYINLIKENIGD